MGKRKNSLSTVNYLDLIPERQADICWHTDLRQRIVLEVENKGFFDRLVQKLFGRPKISKIHLDEMGTFIWPRIDGKSSVQELALQVQAHFGKKAEPLYPRFVKYIQIMEGSDLIILHRGEAQATKKGGAEE